MSKKRAQTRVVRQRQACNKRPFWDAFLISAFHFALLALLFLYIHSDILALLRKE